MELACVNLRPAAEAYGLRGPVEPVTGEEFSAHISPQEQQQAYLPPIMVTSANTILVSPLTLNLSAGHEDRIGNLELQPEPWRQSTEDFIHDVNEAYHSRERLCDISNPLRNRLTEQRLLESLRYSSTSSMERAAFENGLYRIRQGILLVDPGDTLDAAIQAMQQHEAIDGNGEVHVEVDPDLLQNPNPKDLRLGHIAEQLALLRGTETSGHSAASTLAADTMCTNELDAQAL